MVPIVLALLLTAAVHAAEEKIVFSVKDDDNSSTMYSLNPDGTNPQVLFTFAMEPADSSGRIEHIRISPDGRYIAFTSDHDDWFNPYKRNIFHISSDGAWWDMDTPDQAAGAYSAPGGTGTVTGTVQNFGAPHAWVTIEGYPNLIVTDGAGSFSAAGVPEGSRFVTAFSFDYAWFDFVPVAVVADQSVMAPLLVTQQDNWTRGECTRPAWSPNSDVIYWAGLDFSLHSTPRGGDAWADILPGDIGRSHVDVSPVTGKLVYTKDSDGVYTADADGSNVVELFDDQWAYGNGVGVRWSPDGSRIAYTGFHNNSNSVVVIDSSASTSSSFYFPGCIHDIGGWSPDGVWLLVSAYLRDGSTDSVYLYKIQPDNLDSMQLLAGVVPIDGMDWGILDPAVSSTGREGPAAHVAAAPSLRAVCSAGKVTFAFGNPVEGHSVAVLRIYDVAGRMVRCLSVDGCTGERIVWDKTNAGGVPVPPGTYVARLCARQVSAAAHFVLRN